MQEISYPSRSALLLGLTCTRVQMKPKDILFLPISVADPVKQRIYSNMYVPAGSFGNATSQDFCNTLQRIANMLKHSRYRRTRIRRTSSSSRSEWCHCLQWAQELRSWCTISGGRDGKSQAMTSTILCSWSQVIWWSPISNSHFGRSPPWIHQAGCIGVASHLQATVAEISTISGDRNTMECCRQSSSHERRDTPEITPSSQVCCDGIWGFVAPCPQGYASLNQLVMPRNRILTMSSIVISPSVGSGSILEFRTQGMPCSNYCWQAPMHFSLAHNDQLELLTTCFPFLCISFFQTLIAS